MNSRLLLKTLGLLSVLATSSCAMFLTPTHREVSNTANDNMTYSKSSGTSGVTPQTYSRAQFDWPVDRARLTRGYDVTKRRPHLGIDLAGPRKTPIMAAHSGLVIYAGRDFRGFGNMIMIETGTGWATLYAHLDKILVSEGQRIGQGSTIALMGNTGRSTGTHLHFEIRRDKVAIDPLSYLPGGSEASRKLASQSK